MKLTVCILALGMGIFTHSSAKAFDLSDCIINGMKGVSSDIAARQVRFACDQKNQAHKAEQRMKFEKEFGEAAEIKFAEKSQFFEAAGAGKHSIQITNREPARALTFIRLEIVPAPGGPNAICDSTRTRIFAYKTLIKPGASAKLVYPVTAESNCVSVVTLFARQASWRDISFSSTLEPLSVDLLERIQ